jgi:hypothetical protein
MNTQCAPGEYASKVRELAGQWHVLSPDDKEAYTVQAQFEDQRRDELSQTPFKTEKELRDAGLPLTVEHSSGEADHPEDRHFLSKVSYQRLKINMSNFESSEKICSFGLGLQDTTGALRTEFIDSATEPKTVNDTLKSSLHSFPDVDFPVEVDEVHHETCFKLYGQCVCNPRIDEASKFTKAFSKFIVDHKISAGALLRIQSPSLESVNDDVFFGVST